MNLCDKRLRPSFVGKTIEKYLFVLGQWAWTSPSYQCQISTKLAAHRCFVAQIDVFVVLSLQTNVNDAGRSRTEDERSTFFVDESFIGMLGDQLLAKFRLFLLLLLGIVFVDVHR